MITGTEVLPVRLEHHREPIGIGESAPRVSWSVRTDRPDWRQAAYELEIKPEQGAAWTSGRVESAESILLPWGAPPLSSRERRLVRVRVWQRGAADPSDWSDATTVEAGLLEDSDWTAQLIQPAPAAAATDRAAPAALLRREFVLERPIGRGRLYATAHGVYEAQLNGAPVGDDVLAPGWSSYPHRLRYQTYDVTNLLVEGPNALGLLLADGWYRGYLGFGGKREVYGDRTGAFLQLEVEHLDGTRTTVASDGSWRTTYGPISRADIYNGETFDARAEVLGWSSPGFDDAAWSAVDPAELDVSALVAPTGPPVRRTERVAVREVLRSPSGKILLDFGQNLVGRLRLNLPDGEAGTTITLRHAEVLEHGELGTRPLRAALQKDGVILDGRGPREWEPRFTFHGFRYAEITGWPGEFDHSDVEAVVVHTDMRPTGSFTCSDPLVTRLHQNVVWGMRGNFVDVPTDCPQRDERLGWTGDLAVFAPTAGFLYDTAGMLRSWLADLAAEQADHDGVVPIFVPFADISPPGFPPLQPEAGWGDAAILVPWALYQAHGDTALLADQWASMTRWLEIFETRAGADLDFPDGGFMFGDWLDTAAPPDNPAAARTPWQCVALAYLTQSADILAQAAELLGHDSDAYRRLASRAAERFRAEYVTPSGRLAYPSQTAYALAISLDLLLPEQRAHAGRLLAEQVRADGFHIASGFLGTPFVCEALARSGELATAYELLLQRGLPSWLYPVTMGATTIWERWDSMLPDGTINPGEMTSFNHYALGAVADWLHRTVAGLAPAEPGYRKLRIAPQPGPGITSASAEHDSPYGRTAVSWTLDGATFTLDVTVPANTTAEVVLPGNDEVLEAGSGRHSFTREITVPAPVEKPVPMWQPE